MEKKDVEDSFEMMFVPEEEIQHVNSVWGNQWEETFFKGGWGLALILALCDREGVETNFYLMRGGV